MEKILTISIAAYNVEKYIKQTLDSLIIDNMDLLEVLVIVDGGNDKTLDIAKEYGKKYPNTFKVIYKENGGYGSTINKGIELATGKYFKQLDGDDWFLTNNLNEICNKLKEIDDVDVVYTPFVSYYEKDKKEIINRRNVEEILEKKDLEEIINYTDKHISMYFLMYRTQLLKENKIQIREHCFYTDTEYSIFPMYYAKTIKVFNMPLYVYRIGREGQSVSVEGRLKHYKDHMKVDEDLINKYELKYKLSPNMKKYIENYMKIVFCATITEYLVLLKPSKENFNHIKEFDNKILSLNSSIYNKMAEYSKVIRMLRTNNYAIYILCHFIRLIKMKRKF